MPLSVNGYTYNGGVNEQDAQFVKSQAAQTSSGDTNVWGSLFSNSGQFLSGVANIISATKGGNGSYSTGSPINVNANGGSDTAPKNNTIWWVIGGLLLVGLIILLYWLSQKKK